MGNRSAGILLYRRRGVGVEVFLVHPGGPFWTRKDLGAWTIPKGGIHPNETPLAAARREFAEETGFAADGPVIELEPVRQRAGKAVLAFAVQGDCDPAALRSNTFETEWPPRSGHRVMFPEVDRGQWFSLTAAREKINGAQVTLLEDLVAKLAQVADRSR